MKQYNPDRELAAYLRNLQRKQEFFASEPDDKLFLETLDKTKEKIHFVEYYMKTKNISVIDSLSWHDMDNVVSSTACEMLCIIHTGKDAMFTPQNVCRLLAVPKDGGKSYLHGVYASREDMTSALPLPTQGHYYERITYQYQLTQDFITDYDLLILLHSVRNGATCPTTFANPADIRDRVEHYTLFNRRLTYLSFTGFLDRLPDYQNARYMYRFELSNKFASFLHDKCLHLVFRLRELCEAKEYLVALGLMRRIVAVFIGRQAIELFRQIDCLSRIERQND